jgi:hypothetical protein
MNDRPAPKRLFCTEQSLQRYRTVLFISSANHTRAARRATSSARCILQFAGCRRADGGYSTSYSV